MHIDLIDETNELSTEQDELLRNILYSTCKAEGIQHEGELSVVIVHNEQIKQLNNDYRHKNEATDVLSFPLLEREDILQHNGSYPLALGDIVISVEKAKEQAKDYGHSFERELAFLAVHGLLHLLGYTHDTEENEQLMFTKQEAILKEFHLERS